MRAAGPYNLRAPVHAASMHVLFSGTVSAAAACKPTRRACRAQPPHAGAACILRAPTHGLVLRACGALRLQESGRASKGGSPPLWSRLCRTCWSSTPWTTMPWRPREIRPRYACARVVRLARVARLARALLSSPALCSLASLASPALCSLVSRARPLSARVLASLASPALCLDGA